MLRQIMIIGRKTRGEETKIQAAKQEPIMTLGFQVTA